MKRLLSLSRRIDWVNEHIGRFVYWLILVTVLISAGNAITRKLLNLSSNALLEVQWYLFSAVFLLGAGYTLLRNEHVRIDVLSQQWSPRARAWIDILGTVLFLLPMGVIMVRFSWPMFIDSFAHHEVSVNAGGLLRWPVKLLIPVGFCLLCLQGLSELIKRIAFLQGMAPDPGSKSEPHGVESLARQNVSDANKP
jgi:TRAP-type mannitol/chloroaromatic compound transport system permease small subunit